MKAKEKEKFAYEVLTFTEKGEPICWYCKQPMKKFRCRIGIDGCSTPEPQEG